MKDRSARGLDGTATGCARAPGRKGQALKLDGTSGMTVPDSPLLHAGKGFALECWVMLDKGPVDPPMNIITKANEYMLRVDPNKAGGHISFYVKTKDASWEPRARGPRPEAGKWYHIIASWDRRKAWVWVNGKLTASRKPGECVPTSAPVVVGGPAEGVAGLVGRIDEVRFYGHAIGSVGLARRTWIGDKPEPAEKRTDALFEFNETTEGWHEKEGSDVSVRDSALCATLSRDDSLLKVIGLDINAAAYPVATVRMAASCGKRGVCVFVSDKMVKEVPFRLIADGAMHSYTLRCARQNRWVGQIWGMGLRVEGAEDTQVRIDFIRLGETSDAPPDLRILSLAPERRIMAMNKPAAVKAWVRNVGGPAKNAVARLSVPAGVEVEGNATRPIGAMGLDEQKELTWTLQSAKPA
ncbi:MAG: LamG domain-containing protein, partial [Planctomycetes bacterium]|nr:LamG domain-containing protein [Planctomycetota bacterium]